MFLRKTQLLAQAAKPMVSFKQASLRFNTFRALAAPQ